MSDKKPVYMASGGRLKGQRGNYRFKEAYAKWSTPNTSTVSNDPSNQINRAKGEPNKAPEQPGSSLTPTVSSPAPAPGGGSKEQTITDGKTSVKSTYITGQPGKHEPNDISAGARQAYFQQHGKYPPCINPDCKSYGKPHPNCLCFGPTSSEEGWAKLAHGGCVGPHQDSCEHFASGGEAKLNHAHLKNPQDALDHVGANSGLLHLLTKTGHNGRSDNPHKHFEEYVDFSRRGHKSLENHIKSLIGHNKMEIEPGNEDVDGLQSHLEDLQSNPEKAFDVGGQMGSILPDHAAALGSKTANALNYFQSIKPNSAQSSPLDPVLQPSKAAKAGYARQLGIAQNPMLILHHAKRGTLQPQDLKTLHTIYPSLAQSLTEKAGEALIDAKTNKSKIPYHQKQGLSTLLGQPLDSIQTVAAMQAIIKANAPTQAPEGQKQPKKASGKELDQINKTSDLLATPGQQRLLDRKS